jgi:hypothetical protein
MGLGCVRPAAMPGIFYLSGKNRHFSWNNAGFSRSYCYFLRGNAYSLREISIHFQFISSGINRISADIISISAYRKAFYAYIMAAGLHKKCKKHIPPIKEKGNKKERSPAHGCALCSYYARYSNN